jgi:hypothetical protein
MRISLFVKLLLILISLGRPGTSVALPGGTNSDPGVAGKWKPVFGEDFRKGLYRATLDISKNHLTGFMFIKKVSDTSYRILFSNEFGMQIFDFEFSGKEFIVHSCFPSLNRKSLLKLLDNDFRIILFPDYGIKKAAMDRSRSGIDTSYKIKSKTGKWQYIISGSSGKISSINSKGKIFSKTRIDLQYSSDLVTGINISNPFIKLSINLDQISR